ncbi:MAG: phosphoethanolamine--lipid A transferase [Magnetococcales bacterium]|nr:phosphoethanolamine--lipid A transferase [Magnetococcales bacterium]
MLPPSSSAQGHPDSFPAWGISALCSFWFLALCNQRFWQEMWRTTVSDGAGDYGFLVSLFLALFLLFTALLNLLAWRTLFKPLLVLLLLIAAITAYFVDSYSVYINRDMLRNAFLTDTREVRDLLSFSLVLHLLLLGVLPVYWLAKRSIRTIGTWSELTSALLISLGAVLLAAGLIYGQFGHYAAYFRNHRETRHFLVPVNTVYATGGYLNNRYFKKNKPFVAIGTDIHSKPNPHLTSKPVVVVMVVGETARAANFQLGGYERPTNPALSQVENLFYFRDTSSCGTDTATSLPCMFSNLDRGSYDADEARHRENLLDVVKRANIRVIWLDNQAGVGCKGLCDRVEHRELARSNKPEFCDDQECHDEILLDGLQTVLAEPPQNMLIVLHQMGSHGPAYYKRYPKRFQKFEPVCATAALNDCSQAAIVNAYDNTILYTDHVVAGVIQALKSRQEKVAGLVLYASDHGESLGEKNLYLHGIPYRIAPTEQTHIPMLMWMSDRYLADFGLDQGCLTRQTTLPASHFNLFATILGAFDLTSSIYQPALDLLEGCRKPAG